MSEKLSAIVGKSSDFATRFMGGGVVTVGSNGTLVTLTPPIDQRVRLTHLSTADPETQTGISVLLGVTEVINQRSIRGHAPTGVSVFSVGSFQEYGAGLPPSVNFNWWTGAIGEALTIVKNAGNTTQIIYYGYEFGE